MPITSDSAPPGVKHCNKYSGRGSNPTGRDGVLRSMSPFTYVVITDSMPLPYLVRGPQSYYLQYQPYPHEFHDL